MVAGFNNIFHSSFFALIIILVQGALSTKLPVPTPTTTWTGTNPKIANLCPLPERIAPCTCDSQRIGCDGSTISQETVNKLLTEVRDANGIVTNEILVTDKRFTLVETDMTTFDLTPLLNSQFIAVSISANAKLTRIHGPLSRIDFQDKQTQSSSAPSFASIDVLGLGLFGNNLTDEGLADCLHYFSPSLLQLDLATNSFRGPSSKSGVNGPQEFLPGLWNLTNLQYLNLYENNIPILENAPFKALGSLVGLTVGCVGEVGENAFFIDDKDNGEVSESERIIFLGAEEVFGCSLNDDKIHKNHGLASYQGRTHLDLFFDSFEFLSQDKFERFLQINPNNTMSCFDNQFVCDERMKWLKDGRESYEKRVTGVDCTNDQGHTIFTTNLV